MTTKPDTSASCRNTALPTALRMSTGSPSWAQSRRRSGLSSPGTSVFCKNLCRAGRLGQGRAQSLRAGAGLSEDADQSGCLGAALALAANEGVHRASRSRIDVRAIDQSAHRFRAACRQVGRRSLRSSDIVSQVASQCLSLSSGRSSAGLVAA